MEGYASEQEQIEAIKKWWKENGKFIIVGVILGLLVLFGTKTWIARKNSIAEAASMEFEQLLTELKQNNNQAVDERGKHIISSYPKTPYAVFAAMAIARTKLEAGDNTAARVQLQWALDHAENPEIKNTARLRLAKVLIAQGDPAQAVTLLEGANAKNFDGLFEEVRGDAYIAMGDTTKAAQSYKKALALLSPGAATQQLQMKLDDIAPGEN